MVVLRPFEGRIQISWSPRAFLSQQYTDKDHGVLKMAKCFNARRKAQEIEGPCETPSILFQGVPGPPQNFT